MGKIRINHVRFGGFDDCLEMDNGIVRLIVTTQVGPRILYLACDGCENMLHRIAEDEGKTCDQTWRLFGGHRLWAGPQVRFRPNEPEDQPVKYILHEDGVTLTNEIQKESRIQKEIRIRMSEGDSHIQITHRITSWSVWPVELTVWPVTVFPSDGVAFWSNAAPDTFYLPNDVQVFWPWTQHDDPRFVRARKVSYLKADPANSDWFKIGMPNRSGFGVYCGKNQMFVKKYTYDKNAKYSDFGATLEVFCNEEFVELESVSPLYTLESGQTAEHTEHWYVYPNVAQPEEAADMEALIQKYVEGIPL